MGGGGSTYDYGFRIYNPSIAKFLSVDPLSPDYPWLTPYQFADNSPIKYIDLDGLEKFDPNNPLHGFLAMWNTIISPASYSDVGEGASQAATDLVTTGSAVGNGIVDETKQYYDHPVEYSVEMIANTGGSMADGATVFINLPGAFGNGMMTMTGLDEYVPMNPMITTDWEFSATPYYDPGPEGALGFMQLTGTVTGTLELLAERKLLTTVERAAIETVEKVEEKTTQELVESVSGGGSRPDFITTPDGTSVSTDLNKVAKSFDDAGFRKVETTPLNQTYEVPKKDGNGTFYSRLQQRNPNHNSQYNTDRVVNTRNDGNLKNKDYVHPDGRRITGTASKNERREIGHIQLE